MWNRKFGLGKTVERDVLPQVKSQPQTLNFGYEFGSSYSQGYYGPSIREYSFIEDWMIQRGNGAPPVVIREVRSQINVTVQPICFG